MATDDPREMETAHQWLTSVAREFDLDEQLVRRLAGPLLGLTREVAHGRSRPAAPLTAFLVGLAAEGRGETDQVVRDVEKRIDALLDRIAESDNP
ncbi:DUF6457 domain-containing protein [Corynebacterium doosanense]|uniref:Molybdopterin-guanine dinucleotide biosynthesis protein MobA n=2 Tax=Corynebacterium TaxID=1716 RepID=A0A097IDW6_9CORY|nr:DUF6457 domain-containing protein [Corynebacterium doosanense]AIT60317.1 molybdopterin-guanine dinucleotide biosynthesis protein MobA [Corynebacterium doosanense CAU 212 = DSM 45436]